MIYRFEGVTIQKFVTIEVEAEHIDEANDKVYDEVQRTYPGFDSIGEDDWDMVEGVDQYLEEAQADDRGNEP